ncbi:MAG: biotin/lipoyl-binding protein, partial [Candidatus Kapaibacteriota bacterium]
MAKRKSKKRLIVLIAVVALLAVVLISFFAGKKEEIIKVTTAKVERRTIIQTVSAVGKIEPETKVKISSETSGEIIYLGVREGDTVRAGQLLVRIKPDIFETQLEQFKAAADAAKVQIESALAEKVRAESELRRIT